MPSIKIISLALAFLLPTMARADGSVRFNEDVLPLLEQHPEIADPLLREFAVAETGSAPRIGPRICPALAGRRVSPYTFRAKEKISGGAEFQLIVNTNIDFFDAAGRTVFQIRNGVPASEDGNLYDAVSLRESFSSVTLLLP